MFWNNFLAQCAKKGKSPAVVAEELGFSNSATTCWKNGSLPRMSSRKKLADYFGITVDELMGTKKSPPGWAGSTNRCRRAWSCLTAPRRSSATRWRRCCAPGLSRSESADKRQICFGRGFGQDGQNLGDQIRVLPQDSKDLFICHHTKTLLFVVSTILCYNRYKLKSRGKRNFE